MFELAVIAGLFAVFSWPALLFIALCGIWVIWAIVEDRRRGNWGYKWAAIVVLFGVFFSAWALSVAEPLETLRSLSSKEFLISATKTLLFYLAAGLVYSIFIELPMTIRRIKDFVKKAWAELLQKELPTYRIKSVLIKTGSIQEFANYEFKDKPLTLGDILLKTDVFLNLIKKLPVNQEESSLELTKILEEDISAFCREQSSYSKNEPLKLTKFKDAFTPTPSLSAAKLSQCLFTWTILWPGYLVAWVVEDFFQVIFEYLAEVVKAVGDKLVAFSFKGVFDLKD